MKIKMLIALSLALIMIITLAIPALAKPEKLRQIDADTGTGQTSLRVDKDNHLVISVSLRNVIPGDYKIALQYSGYTEVGTFTVNSKGHAHYRDVYTDIGAWVGTVGIMRVRIVTGDLPYSGETWYNTQNTIPVDFR
ncbi:hypothetical protein ACFLYB_03285 [Chloroflexota bacterium]